MFVWLSTAMIFRSYRPFFSSAPREPKRELSFMPCLLHGLRWLHFKHVINTILLLFIHFIIV